MSKRLITDADLGDFSIDNYAGLQTFSFTQWRDLILHRSLLWDMAKTWSTIKAGTGPCASARESARRRAAERGLSDAWTAAESRFGAEAIEVSVKATIATLLCSPLHQAFTLPLYLESGNPLATASIRLCPQPYVGTAPIEPDEFNAALFGALDDVPQAQAYKTTDDIRRIILEVDIDAPNAQLVADFQRWLLRWRSVAGGPTTAIVSPRVPKWVTTTGKRWRGARLVPYIDLKLIAKFLRRDFGEGKLAELLRYDEPAWGKGERKLKRLAREFFGSETLDLMQFLSFEEQRTGPKNWA